MRVALLARRAVAVTGTAAIVASGAVALAPSAFAGTVTNPQTASINNTAQGVTITVATSINSVAFTAGTPTMTIQGGPSGTTLTFAGTGVTASGSNVTGTFTTRNTNGLLAGPGAWTVQTCTAAGCNVPGNSDSAPLTITGTAPHPTGFATSTVVANGTSGADALNGTDFADGDTVSFAQGSTPAPGITYTPNYATSTSTGLAGTIKVATGTAAGAYDVIVKDTAGQSTTCTACLNVTSPPAITTFANQASPPTATIGEGATGYAITLTGTNLQTGLTKSAFTCSQTTTNSVTMQPIACGITFGDPTTDTPTTIVVPLTVPAGEQVDASSNHHTLTITAGNASESVNFTVTAAPTLTAKTVQQGENSTGGGPYVFSGTGIENGAGVGLDSGHLITYTVASSSSAQTVTLSAVAVPTAVAAQTYPISVYNPDGGSAVTSGALKVTALPVVSSASPTGFGRGATADPITVTGTGFGSVDTSGATGKLPKVVVYEAGSSTVDPNITVTVTSVSTDGTTISGTVAVASGATDGPRDLQVVNPDLGTSVTKQSAITITDFDISSVSPSSANNGPSSTAVPLQLTATNLTSGNAYQLQLVPEGTVHGQQPILGCAVASSPTAITVPVNLVDDAPGIFYDVILSDTGATTCPANPSLASSYSAIEFTDSGRVDHKFSITANASPAGTGLAPVTWALGGDGTLTVSGQDIYRGATLTIVPHTGVAACGTSVGFDTTTYQNTLAYPTTPSTGRVSSLTQRIVMTSTTAKKGDTYDVTLCNTDGGKFATPLTFTITADPTVTSVSPASVPGSPAQTVTITGTGIESGATVTLSAEQQSAAIRSANVVEVRSYPLTVSSDGTTATFTFPAKTYTAGNFEVTVTNPDYGVSVASAGSVLTVTPVATALTIVQSATSVVYGSVVYVSGSLTAADGTKLVGKRVFVAITDRTGTSHLLGSALTTSNGVYSVKTVPAWDGTFVAAWQGSSDDGDAEPAGYRGTSTISTIFLSVHERVFPSTHTTASTKPQVITGTVYPGVSGLTVAVYYLDSAGHGHTLGTTKTVAKGAWTFSTTKLGKGTFRLYCTASASGLNSAGSSSVFSVTRT